MVTAPPGKRRNAGKTTKGAPPTQVGLSTAGSQAEKVAEFSAALDTLLGTQRAGQVLDTMHAPKRQGVWVNPLKPLPPAEIEQAFADWSAQRLTLNARSTLWVVPAEHREALVRHPLTVAGHLYPINPSSAWAAQQLPVAPGQEVLDLAAAPGGKTLLLAAALGDASVAGSRIAAVEPVAGRFHRMRANLARCGVESVQFYQADGRGIGAKVGERFDAVLLDAPCSSEARVRLAEPATLDHWSPRKIRETQRKQKRLLQSAFAALKPNGLLLYCTCAFSFAENEGVLLHLLKREPSAALMPLTPPTGLGQTQLMPGLTSDPSRRRRNDHASLALACRVLPDDLWDGFFCALLRKKPNPAFSG